MSDTKTSQPAKPLPLGLARRGLTIGGIGLVALNLVLMVSGAAGSSGSLLSALMWGGAAVCFLGAFVVFMMEPANQRDAAAGKAPAPKADGPKAAEAKPEGETAAGGAPKSVAPGAEGEGDATKDGDTDTPSSEPDAKPLIRRGNPLRWTRGGLTAGLGSLFAFLLMAHPGQWRIGVPLGAAFVAIASWGFMDLLGTFDDPDERVVRSNTLGELASPLVAFGLSFFLFLASLGFAHAGRGLPQLGWGIVVTLTFLLGVVTLFGLGKKLGAWATDEEGVDRPFYKRHGFWLVVIAAVLYFPLHGQLLAVGSVGDALRRGLARDPRARRLDLALVGAGRLVLVEADPRLLDPGDRDGDARRPLPARPDAHRRRHAAALPPRVGGARADRAADDPRDVPPLQGRREDVRAAGGPSSAGSCWPRCPTGSSSRTRR